jgi:A/G-specific adenine glycosylase
MYLWAGLGYYTRARNLHRTAQIVSNDYQGHFPSTAEELETLPGIGKSTAGAIAAIAFKQKVPILDGNVKRVLSRLYGVEEPLDNHAAKKRLWHYAEQLVPQVRADDYTQAMMDLGSIICTKRNPICVQCPIKVHCHAYHHDMTQTIPAKKPTKTKPIKHRYFFIIVDKNYHVLVERLPPTGVWGGLWCLPYCEHDSQWQELIQNRYHMQVHNWQRLERFYHIFSHYQLYGYPIVLPAKNMLQSSKVADNCDIIWYDTINNSPSIGLPKPMQKLIDQMRHL